MTTASIKAGSLPFELILIFFYLISTVMVYGGKMMKRVLFIQIITSFSSSDQQRPTPLVQTKAYCTLPWSVLMSTLFFLHLYSAGRCLTFVMSKKGGFPCACWPVLNKKTLLKRWEHRGVTAACVVRQQFGKKRDSKGEQTETSPGGKR